MVIYGRLRLDWVQALNMHDALVDVIAWEPVPRYAIVTCIDSTRDMNLIPGVMALAREDAEYSTPVNGAVIGPADRLIPRLLDMGILTGFDEIWFTDRIPTENPGHILPITSEAPIPTVLESVNSGTAVVLESWMSTNDCLLGMGDGYGLNYVTISNDVARRMDLLRNSIASTD